MVKYVHVRDAHDRLVRRTAWLEQYTGGRGGGWSGVVQYLLHVIRVRQSANEFGPWVGGSIVIDTWGKKEVEVPPTGPVLDLHLPFLLVLVSHINQCYMYLTTCTYLHLHLYSSSHATPRHPSVVAPLLAFNPSPCASNSSDSLTALCPATSSSSHHDVSTLARALQSRAVLGLSRHLSSSLSDRICLSALSRRFALCRLVPPLDIGAAARELGPESLPQH